SFISLSLPLILSLTISALIYQNALSAPYIFDDFIIICFNHQMSSWHDFLSGLYLGPSHTYPDLRSRPLLYLYYYLVRLIGKNDPYYFRMLLIVLHSINIILVYALIKTIINNFYTSRNHNKKILALLTTAFWALHPIHAYTVGNISKTSTVLASCFFLLSVMCFVRTLENKQSYLSVIFFSLSFASKEEAVVLPFFLLLWILFFTTKEQWQIQIKKAVPHFVALILILLARYFAFNSNFYAPGLKGDFNFSQAYAYGLNQVVVVALYLFQLIFPTSTSKIFLYYPIRSIVSTPFALEFIAAFLFLLMLVGVAIFFTMKNFITKNKMQSCWRPTIISILFLPISFFLLISPASSFIPQESLISGCRTYLPSIFFSLLFMMAIKKASDYLKQRFFLKQRLLFLLQTGFFVYGIVFFSYTTYTTTEHLLKIKHVNILWKEEMIFFESLSYSDPELLRTPYMEIMNLYMLKMSENQHTLSLQMIQKINRAYKVFYYSKDISELKVMLQKFEN
ncbi:MAG: glycosyltransferase family 39 protein, partial [Oligoflexia bacterium]|nr:glycosyltransferase family 39 protein [Oligoflexia bacterium]